MIESLGSKSKYTIKQILKDNNNWDNFCDLNKNNIRPVVIENVSRIMDCGNKDKLGYSMYMCPTCGNKNYVAHTCKSRFCNSCGKAMTDKWINWAESNMLNCPYNHIIFSPPSELWIFFVLIGNV